MSSCLKPFSLFLFMFLCVAFGFAQSTTTNVKPPIRSSHDYFYEYRGNNVLTGGLGASLISNGEAGGSYGFYGQLGYKQHVTPYLNFNLTFNAFSLEYDKKLNKSFMSLDLNLESVLMPDSFITPYVYLGGGMKTTDKFSEKGLKVQGGFGGEYMLKHGFGIKVFAEYNHTFLVHFDERIFGESNVSFWRVGLGINYYLGKTRITKKQRISDDEPTIINSNPIKYK
ncbi:MAG: Curli production assembly/transport component CsgG [Oceanihabitans sediminis]|nr:Curli production assembly/transport component CsgG [Oceanihabitans sediminis]